MTVGDEFEALVRSFQESCGLSAEPGRVAARGRGGPVTESFKALGSSDQAARTAAIGRGGSELSARRRGEGSRAPGRRAGGEIREADRKADRAALGELGRQIEAMSEVLRAPSTRWLLDGR